METRDFSRVRLHLIERELKTEIEVPCTNPAGKMSIWADPKYAKEHYDMDVPTREPNK